VGRQQKLFERGIKGNEKNTGKIHRFGERGKRGLKGKRARSRKCEISRKKSFRISGNEKKGTRDLIKGRKVEMGPGAYVYFQKNC